MTTLQVAYQQALEQERHNREMERETNRSNVAKETETNRSNVAKESETYRSNLAREVETNRANVAQEGLIRTQNAIKWVDVINKTVTGGRGIFGTLTDIGGVISGVL